jgi:hypothetical protein
VTKPLRALAAPLPVPSTSIYSRENREFATRAQKESSACHWALRRNREGAGDCVLNPAAPPLPACLAIHPHMVHGRPRLQTAGGLSAEAAESVAVKWLRKRSVSEKAVRLLDDEASLLRPSSFSSKPPTPYGQCAAAATLRTLILALQPRPPNSREHWTQTGAAVSSRRDQSGWVDPWPNGRTKQ